MKSVPSHSRTKDSANRPHHGGDTAARRLALDRNRDRKAVVFHQNHERQFVQTGGVNAFPEFAFARRAFARAHQGDLIAPWIDIAARVSAPDCLQQLRACRGGTGNNMQFRRTPMGRHLPATGGTIRRGAHGLQKHVLAA